jgi:XRE family transcriptional regulator, regulator of sulfur utilization
MTIDREPTSIGQRVRQLRKDRQWSQSKLAREAELAQNVLSRVEVGAVVPSLPTLEKIAAALGVGVADLLNGSTPAPTEVAG